MSSKEEQNMQKNLRIFIKIFISQDMLNRFSSSLDEFKSLDKSVITLLSNEMNMHTQNIHKHFNGEQKYDAIDFLRYWRTYSKLWDKYYKLDAHAKEDMDGKVKISIEKILEIYDMYFKLIDMSYNANPEILVHSSFNTFIQLLKFLEKVKKDDAKKKNPVLKPHHLKVIEKFKEIPLLRDELAEQKSTKYKLRLERIED